MDIQLHGLSKVYRGRVRALDQLDLEIASGMFGLLGPNGAGKTTLMRKSSACTPTFRLASSWTTWAFSRGSTMGRRADGA